MFVFKKLLDKKKTPDSGFNKNNIQISMLVGTYRKISSWDFSWEDAYYIIYRTFDIIHTVGLLLFFHVSLLKQIYYVAYTYYILGLRTDRKTNFSKILPGLYILYVDIVLTEVPRVEKCQPESIAYTYPYVYVYIYKHFLVLFILRWMAQPISLRLGKTLTGIRKSTQKWKKKKSAF